MSLRHKITGGLLLFFGMLFFGFGLYILPFGTDAYMYFWVEMVYKGDWIKGDIAANAAALAMIAVGAVMLWKSGHSPVPRELEKKDEDEKEDDNDMDVIIIKPKTKSRRKKTKKNGGSKKWLRL